MNYSIWGISNTLTNYFAELTHPDYKTQEIRLLMRQFERSQHPVSTKIHSLLNEVVVFRAATSPEFTVERKESASVDTIVNNFNKIGKAIENAERECTMENKESNEFMIYSKAIDYALASIQERFNKIKQNDKFLMGIYNNNQNELKNILDKKNIRPVL